MQNIILIGMPGCGKTTIGKLLAQKLNREFIDSDKVFEETICPDITEYFSTNGEDDFRREETKILRKLSQKNNCIIATGGGVVERQENKEILQSGGTVVFIDRNPEDIYGDIDATIRPILLANGKDRIFTLYDRRYEKYRDYCHIRTENIGTLEEIAEKIINEVNQYNG